MCSTFLLGCHIKFHLMHVQIQSLKFYIAPNKNMASPIIAILKSECLSQGFYSCTNIMTKKQVGEERVYSAYTSMLLFITKGSQDWNSSRSGNRSWCRGHGGMFLTVKLLDYILKASHQGLFPYLVTSSPEADYQGPAIKVVISSNQKSLLGHLVNTPHWN